jgi:hypothetical protein
LAFVLVLVLERDFRRNEQKAAKVAKKNGRQTFAIFALLTCNFAEFREDFHAEVAE